MMMAAMIRKFLIPVMMFATSASFAEIAENLSHTGGDDPVLTFTGIDGAFFRIAPPDLDGLVLVSDGIVTFTGTDRDYKFYSKPDASENGGFEFEVVFKIKPSSNVVRVPIDLSNMTFYYQPPLNEEPDLSEEDVVCTSTQCFNGEGAVTRSRPENVVGSYAVYYTSPENGLSRKAFHIYRPKMIDALANEEWASMSIREGNLVLTMPQNFLDTATYPIILDPTFGYTDIGASNVPGAADDLYANVETAPEDGTVTDLTFHFDSLAASRNCKGVLTNDGALTILTNGVGDPVDTSAGGAWFTSTNLSASITGSSSYLLGVICDFQMSFSYDTGSSGDGERDTTNSYTTPEDWGSSSPRSEIFSIYATYTAAGGGERRVIIVR